MSQTTTPATMTQFRPALMHDDKIARVQKRLYELLYPVGIANGEYGPRTLGAICAFQAVNDLPLTGKLDLKTMQMLSSPLAKPMPISADRSEASKEQVAKLVPTVQSSVTACWWNKLVTIFSGVSTLVCAALPLMTTVEGFLEPYHAVVDKYIPGWGWPLIVFILSIFAARALNGAVSKGVEDFRKGRIMGHNKEDMKELNPPPKGATST